MKKRTNVFLLLGYCFFSLILTRIVIAQEVHTLEKITVKGIQEKVPERNVQIIDIGEKTPPVISTTPDILKSVSGVDIQARSLLTPKSSQVRIRGFDERRSLILLDGRPLNGTGVYGGFFVDWSSLSLLNLTTIDVGKGAGSAQYGNTLGGTINLISTKPSHKPESRFYYGYKTYNTFKSAVGGSFTKGPVGVVIGAGYQSTDGHLRNTEAERTDFNLTLSSSFDGDGQIIASSRYTDGEYEMVVQNKKTDAKYDSEFDEHAGSYLIGPGIQFAYWPPPPDKHGDKSFYTKKRWELDLAVKKNILGLGTEGVIYYNQEDRTDTIYSYNTGEKVQERNSEPDNSWGWLTKVSKKIDTHGLGLGAEGNYLGYGGLKNTFIKSGTFTPPPSDSDAQSNASRRHGLYVDDQWKVTEGLDLYVGLRYEDYYADQTIDAVQGYDPNNNFRPGPWGKEDCQFDEGVLLPKFGAVYQPTQDISLQTRIGRATRMPDNPDFYWYYGGYRPELDRRVNIQRKDLTYEDALQYEIGFTYSGISNLNLGLTGYYYRVDNYIRTIFGYAPSRVVYNVDLVDFKGIECDLEGKFNDHFSTFANVTYQNTKKEGDVLDASSALTDKLSELPEYKANGGIKYLNEKGAMAKISLRWVDEREVPTLQNAGSPDGAPIIGNAPSPVLQKMDDFLTVDLYAEYPVWKNEGIEGTIALGIENLFDETYEEEYDFPSPGRMYSASLKMKF